MGTKEDKLTKTVARFTLKSIFHAAGHRLRLARLAMITGVGLVVWNVDDEWKWIVGGMLIVGGFLLSRRKS